MLVGLLALAALVLVIEGVRKLRRPRSPAGLPLPPGPTPIPFLGNILGVNTGAPHLTYTAWSKTYGDVVYTRVLGQEVIILNSEEVAIALLEKRSQKYSDRPVFSVVNLLGAEWLTSAAPYGSRFRLHRKLLHQFFRAQAAMAYRPKQMQSAYQMLTQLLNDPTHYDVHFTAFSASVVMAVTYGCDMKEGETFVASMRRSAAMVLRFSTPEISAICTAFPFVMALPAWFPGMGFKYEALESRRLFSEALHSPYAWVKRRIDEGNAAPCMVGDAITRHGLADDSKDPVLVRALKDSAATLYAASVGATAGTLLTFVYLMMNHPEVQRRAQAEIDRVIGRQRLPVFEDRASLPYLDAVLRETMRWYPVAPIGIPHATTEDDVYQGYYIPRGVIIIANNWAISHDENRYPNPEAFMPERFLRDDGTLNEDTVPWAFGFGRRICPGRHIGDASLWSAMVCMLALFRIDKVEGSENVNWEKGLTAHPLPFPCAFAPRDEKMNAEKLASLICATRAE